MRKKIFPKSVIDYRTLRQRKRDLNLINDQIIAGTGMGSRLVSAILNGCETVMLGSIIRLAYFLGFRVKVTFELITEAEDFEDSQASGLGAPASNQPRRREPSRL
jgi:hypothetical protein